MDTCEMYALTVSGGASGRDRRELLCGNCGFTTIETACVFCPNCGAQVASVEDDGDECDALKYARETGFDEGYQAAREEMEG